jgi:hypothetical protein
VQALSEPVLSSSDTLVATFTAQFPGAVLSQDTGEISARGLYAIIEQNQDIYDKDVAQAYADGILAKRLNLADEFSAIVFEPGLKPLMSATVTWPGLSISAAFLITNVRLTRITAERGRVLDEFWAFAVTGIQGNLSRSNWIDYFLGLENSAGTGSGGTGAIVTGGVSPAAIAYADWGGSRQFGIAGTSGWVDVREWRDIVLSADARVNVRIDRRTENASVSVKARVYDYTAAAAVVTGTSSTSTSWAEEVLSFDGDAGHRYRLQAQPGSSSNDHEVYVVGIGA